MAAAEMRRMMKDAKQIKDKTAFPFELPDLINAMRMIHEDVTPHPDHPLAEVTSNVKRAMGK
ncbi:MAG: hypothetical protein ABJF50_22445 [Paracoccaceae bacterium]